MSEPTPAGEQLAVVVFCPGCKARGDGQVSEDAFAKVAAGAWTLDCPLCGTPCTLTRRTPPINE